MDYTGTFQDRYEKSKFVSYTTSGTVWEGIDKMLDRKIIIKYIDCVDFSEDISTHRGLKYNEIEMNNYFNHPAFLKMLDYEVTEELVTIVYEHFENSTNLLDYYYNNKLSWYEIYLIIQQIAVIIRYAHNIGVCLGCVHPENFLIIERTVEWRNKEMRVQRNKQIHVKLISLNHAARLWRKPKEDNKAVLNESGDDMPAVLDETHCDEDFPKEINKMYKKLFYTSPENLKHKYYRFPADIFAFGVLCFFMCTGYFPFDQATRQGVKEMKKGIVRNQQLYLGLPEKLTQLILKCMSPKAHNRFVAKDLTEASWFREMKILTYCQMKDYIIYEELENKKLLESLVNIRFKNEMCRLIYAYMCEQYYDKNKMLQAGLLYRMMDTNCDGEISFVEMGDYLNRFYTGHEAVTIREKIFRNIDINYSETLEWNELRIVGMGLDMGKIEKKLYSIYNMASQQKDKKSLTFDELMTCIQEGNTNYSWMESSITPEMKETKVNIELMYIWISQIMIDVRKANFREFDDDLKAFMG